MCWWSFEGKYDVIVGPISRPNAAFATSLIRVPALQTRVREQLVCSQIARLTPVEDRLGDVSMPRKP